MARNESAYKEFQTLWQQAKNPLQDIQVYEVADINTDLQPMFLLPHLSSLADGLKKSKVIDRDQYDQMVDAITKLKDIIKTIDHQVLSDVTRSLKKT